jgi:hypothetical protein
MVAMECNVRYKNENKVQLATRGEDSSKVQR